MATKKEMLGGMKKADLLKLAEKAKVTTVKTSMKKSEMVDKLARTNKVRKADLPG